MKKIVRQQNYLKELIASQSNRVLTRQALVCLIRAVLEPLLDNPEAGVVLHRIVNKDGLLGLIKRLEFSEVEDFNFTDESGNLREKVWANTEFLCVMTHRFVSIIVWTNNEDGTVNYYSVNNSKLQSEALDIIDRNTTMDLRPYQERFKPDRRDNSLLNLSIRRIVENLDEASKDAVLGFAQDQAVDYNHDTRVIAHEIRNQLSICDLYTEIIKKYCAKDEFNKESIENALNCISRAIKIAGNNLVSLKSANNVDLKPHNLKDLVNQAVDLTKVYFECKNIEYIINNDADVSVLADENKFVSVLINLVKNATEAFEDVQDGKYIKIETNVEEDFALVKVANNGGEIPNPEKIFEKGFTTKGTGSGLGLCICKNSMEEQLGKLELAHTGKDYTEFMVRIGLV